MKFKFNIFSIVLSFYICRTNKSFINKLKDNETLCEGKVNDLLSLRPIFSHKTFFYNIITVINILNDALQEDYIENFSSKEKKELKITRNELTYFLILVIKYSIYSNFNDTEMANCLLYDITDNKYRLIDILKTLKKNNKINDIYNKDNASFQNSPNELQPDFDEVNEKEKNSKNEISKKISDLISILR